MYEIVFPDADPEAVRLFNRRQPADSDQHALNSLEPGVDWSDTTYGYGGVERSVLFAKAPEHREVEELMEALGATACLVRRVDFEMATS